MKTVLRALFVTAFLFIGLQGVLAQCRVTESTIHNLSKTPEGSGCIVTYNQTFRIENSAGNHFIYISSWLQTDYANPFNCTLNGGGGPGQHNPPDHNDLADAFATIVIRNTGAGAPSIINNYAPDPLVPTTSVDAVTRTILPDGSAVFTLIGVMDTIPYECGEPILITSDFWSLNNQNSNRVNCISCNNQFPSDYLSALGLANCALRRYNATITNNVPCSVAEGYYEVYADFNGNGVFDPLDDALITDSTDFVVNCACLGGNTLAITGNIPVAYLNMELFLVLTQENLAGASAVTSSVIFLPTTFCAPLPVTFQSFKASRINSAAVALRWETATEINNSGFAVLRNTGGNWDFVTFIPSQALNGNSSSTLVYNFTDMNSYKGISQYRIRQVDLDGKAKYTDIRAVRGDAQVNKVIVYPNPSTDGRVTIVFDDRDGIRDLILYDNTGRSIRQWRGVSGNTVQVDNLGSGMYSLKIMIRETGMQQVEKILVVKQ